MIARWVAAIALLAPICLAHAAPTECAAKSGPRTAVLVELYTSEGCNSCPPADEWLRKLPAAGFGADRVVPLALHVDYWDYIGWKDRFANAGFSARQREIAAINRTRAVYTPQVVLAGRDYGSWPSASRFAADVDAVNAMPARAEVGLALQAREVGSYDLRASEIGRAHV